MSLAAFRWHCLWIIVSCVGLLWSSAVWAEEKPSQKSDVKAHESPVVAIKRALAEPVDFGFVDTPLSDVVEFVQDQFDVRVLLDRKAMDDAGVAVDTPVTIQVRGVSLKSGLSLILRQLEMACIVRDETLTITTAEAAAQHLETRVYPVRDLLQLPDGTDATSIDDYQAVISVIQDTIEPHAWTEVGGLGSVRAVPKVRALVISQTERVHDEIEQMLADLRKVRDGQ